MAEIEGRRRLITLPSTNEEAKLSEDELGVVRMCGMRTLPSHRHLGLAAVLLVSTAYFAMEMSTVRVGSQATLTMSEGGIKHAAAHDAMKAMEGPPGPDEGRSYANSGYPWAQKKGGKKAFLQKMAEAAKVVQSERDALWALHEPVSEHLFPTVHYVSDVHLKARMARALLAQDNFTIGVMGTSVTAGHDNFFNQSYPVVWGRLMNSSFAAAGVGLEMRNHAMGWNPIHPSYYCVGEMVGEDVDVGVWEFAMMGGDDGDMETWVRMALMLPNQPHLLLLDPGLGARDNAEGPREGTPNPWDTEYMHWYTDHGYSIASQVMEHAYWKTDHLPNYNAFSMIPKDKPTERPAGWHPGPHGHELRAQILAWNYLRVLQDAIAAVVEAVEGSQDLRPVLPKTLELPEPHRCDEKLCKCVTTFVPRAGPSLLKHVAYPDVDTIPWVEDWGKAQSNEQTGWHMQLYFCDVSSVTYMLDKHFDYLDRKYILQGGKNDGPVRLEYEQTSENHLIVCSAPGNSHLCKSSRWKVDGVEAKCMDEEAARNAGMPTVKEPCFITEQVYGPGKHIFEVEMLEPWQDHDNFIPLSHLIWY